MFPELRKSRADLIEIYKIIAYMEYHLSRLTRSLNLTAMEQEEVTLWSLWKRTSTDLRRHFFSERVINNWNSLRGGFLNYATQGSCVKFYARNARNIRNATLRNNYASNARNATRELNPCSNFTQATQGLTNHMASFHLIVTARAQIGLSPLPVQPRWAI